LGAMLAPSALIVALLSVALGDLNRHDPVVIGKTFLAGGTDPTQGSTGWALTSHGIAEKLFTVGRDGSIVGQVAESVSKQDTDTWDVTLKAGYKFSDGTTVTARHVADALTELNTVNSKAQASLGAMTMTVVNDLTVRIQSERATPVMDAVLAEFVFVVYLKTAPGAFVFTGPYAVETFAAGDRIELVPNTHYAQAVERPLLVVKKFADGDAVAAALQNGSLDMGFHLPIDTLTALRQVDGLTIKSFEVGYQYMMFHQMRRSPLSDLRVRRAVDTAIDRVALRQALAGGKATRSLFPDNTPYFLDESDAHGDKSGAEALLDEAGWVMGGNGKRAKNGTELELTLVAYPQRPGLVIMQPVVEQALSALGINVTSITTSGASWDQLDQIMADNAFDLLMWAQNTLPAGDPIWFLNAFFRSEAGGNTAGLNSSSVDSLLDALALAEAGQRVSAAAAAHTAILQEVPVSNLVTPEWHVGLSSRLSGYEPWCSDYYVIRPDLFVTADLSDSAIGLIPGWLSVACLSFLASFLFSGF